MTYVSNSGVMLTFDNGESAMLSCDSLELAIKLIGDFPYRLVAIHQSEMKDELCRRYNIGRVEECWQCVYGKDEPLFLESCDIRRLGMDKLPFLLSHYEEADEGYMTWLIQQGVMYGIYEENELAGFIGRHSEGSIGLLTILPQYRRKGLGEKLLRFYVNQELSQGHRPYAQILVGNEASRRLNEKIGMEFAENTVCWLWKD